MSVIELSLEEIMKCRKFALNVVETNLEKYKQRNQFNKKKIIKDIYVGKKAEIAAWKYLSNSGLNVNEPDFEIYGAKRKSFDADIKDNDNDCNYHVKSMTKESADTWGLSWSFQIEDPLVHSPEDKDKIILCEVLDKFRVDVKIVIEATVAQGLYGIPKLYKLKRIKKVLYWDDIENYLKDNK